MPESKRLYVRNELVSPSPNNLGLLRAALDRLFWDLETGAQRLGGVPDWTTASLEVQPAESVKIATHSGGYDRATIMTIAGSVGVTGVGADE